MMRTLLVVLISATGCATVQDSAYITQGVRPAAVDLTAHILRDAETGLTPRWAKEAEELTYGTDDYHRPDMLWAAARAEVRLSMLSVGDRYAEGVRLRCAFVRDRFALARRLP